ncbi:MAG: WYL domain-containing protein [Clostridia bacterium]|nr:WYL domain-containing protein [Clostridia bacterium]
MPKYSNQKLKILYILDYLMKKTDEDHLASTSDLLNMLESHGIHAERKGVYNDIVSLKEFGFDILSTRGKNSGFYLVSRDFQLPELKLLVDSIQTSKFVTEKKTLELIRKLEGLASEHQAKTLHRQVYVSNRIKSMNESVYYNVDDLFRAINEDKKIEFQYATYNEKKEKEYRHDGKVYCISPFALIVDNQQYYVVGWESETELMKNFRVDLMEKITVTKKQRDGKEEFEKISIESYTEEIFNMYGGTEVTVKLRVSNDIARVIFDRFGRDVWTSPDDDTHFIARVKVALSPQFYGFIFPLVDKLEILSPEEAREGMKQLLDKAVKMY